MLLYLHAAPEGQVSLRCAVARRELDLYAYASNSHGEFKSFFHRQLTIDPGKGAAALAAGGIKYYGHFVLPADDYLVRVLVRDEVSGRLGAAAVPITVPDYSKDQPTLLPPLFFDSPGHWSLVRERTASDSNGSEIYPFVVGGEPFVPQAGPSFRAGDRPRLCVSGYNLGAEKVQLEGFWLTASGDVPFELVADSRPTGNEDYRQWLMRLDLSGLAAGEHRFRVAVVDAASGRALATTTGSLKIEG